MSVTHSLARAALVTAITGPAAPALAGPGFVADDRANPLAASDARSELEPMEDIVFPLDTATPGSTALDQIAAVVRWLDVHPGYRVVVEGHTDSTGAASYNAALGTRRAVLVANRLIDRGVDPDRVVIAVYGENGARRRPDPLDRRVVMFATAAEADLGRARSQRRRGDLDTPRHPADRDPRDHSASHRPGPPQHASRLIPARNRARPARREGLGL